MSRLIQSDKLAETLAIFGRKLEILSSNNEFNWNIHAENIFIPILNKLYEANFVNVNAEENQGYPAIDLVDFEKKISFQITSEDSFSKIKKTAEKFITHEHFKKINGLYILFLKTKARSTNITIEQESIIKSLLKDEINFDRRKNLLDFSKIYQKCQTLDIVYLEELNRKLESEVGQISNSVLQYGPVTTLIFDDSSDLDIAEKVLIGLVESGIRVKHFSNKLKERISAKSELTNLCELIYDVSKESKTSIILFSTKLKMLIKNNTMPLPLIETLKNQHYLHLLFRLDAEAAISEFNWIRPMIFVANREKPNIIVDKACIELRKIQKVKEIKAYDDFRTIIGIYDSKSEVISTTNIIERKNNIGYTLIETRDQLKNISTYYIYLFQGSFLKPSAAHLYNKFPLLKINQNNIVLFLAKEIQQKQLDERLNNAKKAFKVGNVFYLDEFIWKFCTNHERTQDDPNYHFSDVENFVTPIIKSIEGPITDLDLIENWFMSEHDPILVITGSGGIGKTTTTKVIADRFSKLKNNSNIFFIEATDSTIVNYLIRTSEYKQLDIYDFYKASYETNAINKDLFRINIDNGNFLLIIDGLDEVFSRIADFDIDNFIASISEDFIKEIGVGKVILTCRTYFWNDQVSKDSNINHLEILPFNNELTKKFFEGKFDDVNLVRKALKLVNEFNPDQINDNGNVMPYVLDVIGKIVEAGDDVQLEDINNASYLNLKFKTDYIVYKLFSREEKKINQINIEDQCKFFITFAVLYEGKVASKLLPQLWMDNFTRTISNVTIESLKSHPLLQEHNGYIIFRYNLFENFFKTLYISNFLAIENNDKPSLNLIRILITEGKYGSSLFYDIANRFENWGVNSQLRISDIIETIRKDSFQIEEAPINYKEKFISGIFSLALTINQKQLSSSTEQNTTLLKAIFEKNQNTLSGIAMINLTASNNNLKFDFKDLKIINSYFDGYEAFWDCQFNENTEFTNCTFLNLPFPKQKNQNQAQSSNFINPRKDTYFDDFFSWKTNTINSKSYELQVLLEKYFKIYYSNGYLQPQKIETVIHRRYNAKMQSVIKVETLEGILKQMGVITIEFDKIAGENKAHVSKNHRDDITKFVKEATVSIKIKSMLDKLLESTK